MDSDSEENECNKLESNRKKPNYRQIIDSDSSDEENNKTEVENADIKKSQQDVPASSESEEEKQPNRRKGVPKKLDVKILKEKLKRKSAKVAMENIKEELNLQNDNENEQREIRIPYHKPKQYSLKEFLARRTINKPSNPIEKINESKAINPVLKIKMNTKDPRRFCTKNEGARKGSNRVL